MVHTVVLCAPDWDVRSLVWELVCGDWRTGPEQELLLTVGRWTEGTGGRKSTAEMPMEEDWTAMEAGRYC